MIIQHWNQENEEIKAQKTKQKLLKAHEKAKKEFPIRATEVDANQTPSRVNQIVGKVIENLHVFIDNIHIRVETEDFDFGFTLKNFGVATQRFDDTDATIPKVCRFILLDSSFIYKTNKKLSARFIFGCINVLE
jgi:hypothetical protein